MTNKKAFFREYDFDLIRLLNGKIMSNHTAFEINRPQVISQILDGEVVVINLQTGSYYSLTGTAAAIWEGLERIAAAGQITGLLAARFTDCDAGLENIVEGFINELLSESLIVPAQNGGATTAGALSCAQIEPRKFIRPELKKFTDMRELLLLDPIHEVDATGWPLAKSDPDNAAHK